MNIYTFLKLAENPNRSGQDVLEQFVKEYYPPSAHQAAINLYRYSLEFQKTMYYLKGEYLANHSRVQDEDAEDNLDEIQEKGFLTKLNDFDARRNQIDKAYETTLGLIDRMGKDVSPEWIQGLKDGARIEHYVARATNYKIQAIFSQHKRTENVDPSIQTLKDSMRRLAQEWRNWHPESYESMEGKEMFEIFKED